MVGSSSPILHWDGRSFRVERTALDKLKRVGFEGLSALSARDIWAAGGDPLVVNGVLGQGLLARYSCV